MVERCIPNDLPANSANPNSRSITYEVVDSDFDFPCTNIEFVHKAMSINEQVVNSHKINMLYRGQNMQTIEHRFGGDRPKGAFDIKLGCTAIANTTKIFLVRPVLTHIKKKKDMGHLKLPDERPKGVRVRLVN